jgi:hypothetical protein
MTPQTPAASGSVAYLVLAHNDPLQVRRLRAALEPAPVFLHVDQRTAPDVFDALTAGVPARHVVAPRARCGWASFGLVEAELAGYRQVLAESTADHIVLMSGADYPLRSADDIARYLGSLGDRSIARFWPLPFAPWGRSGGLARLRYRHWAFRRRMIRWPVPRPLPPGLATSGASQWKILARRHAQALLDAVDARPDLVAFWRRTWCPDETFVPTMLRSPLSGVDWDAENVTGEAWWIGWDGTRRKSPPWLTADHFDALAAAATGSGRPVPALFTRKVSTALSGPLLDRVDAELRAAPLSAAVPR